MIYRVTASREDVERIEPLDVTVYAEQRVEVYEGPSYTAALTGCSIYEGAGWRTQFYARDERFPAWVPTLPGEIVP